MDLDTLLQDQLNVDILSLLLVSRLAPAEKKTWILLLQHMKVEQKEVLKENLRKEMHYEARITKEVAEEFMRSLDAIPSVDDLGGASAPAMVA